MADDSKVVSLVHTEPDKLAAACDEFARKLPVMVQHMALVAKLQRAAYLHYVAEGFTEAQALELAKTIR